MGTHVQRWPRRRPSLLWGGDSPATIPPPTTIDPTQSDQVWTWDPWKTNCPAARVAWYEGKRSFPGLPLQEFCAQGCSEIAFSEANPLSKLTVGVLCP